jgi:hypothetical protein
MNPGYGGRTELPDNLKTVLRPVSLMAPDARMIAEVLLFSEGFANGKVRLCRDNHHHVASKDMCVALPRAQSAS